MFHPHMPTVYTGTVGPLSWKLHHGDNMDLIRGMPDNCVDAVVTDPPYLIDFMGRKWDASGAEAAFHAGWTRECLRVLKPGGHLVSFAATRTYHHLACAVEDAGFEIRDMLAWIYGSGMPKGQNLGVQMDKHLGTPRTQRAGIKGGHEGFIGPWMSDPKKVEDTHYTMAPSTPEGAAYEGWSTALKPAQEPLVLARKPLSEGTIAANVLRWGTGAMNIGDCRVELTGGEGRGREGEPTAKAGNNGEVGFHFKPGIRGGNALGRWPANILHDGSDEVLEHFPDAQGQLSGLTGNEPSARSGGPRQNCYNNMPADRRVSTPRVEANKSAARFFASHAFGDVEWLDINLPGSSAKSAEGIFCLQNALGDFVQSDAVTWALPGVIVTVESCQAHSMNVTANELRLVCTSAITAIQFIASKSSLELLPEKAFHVQGPVSYVARRRLTGTMTITLRLSRSDGSVENATLGITPRISVLGVQDYAKSPNRFMYCPKATKTDRAGSNHPTVKPIALMRWLVRLLTPRGGCVLDPFGGSGTTGAAAIEEGCSVIMAERESQFVADIVARMNGIGADG